MAKRRLTHQQSRRIQQKQSANIRRAEQTESIDQSSKSKDRQGIVISHYGSQVDVEDIEDSSRHRCHFRAKLNTIATGDRVIWRKGNAQGQSVIESILPRHTELCRPDIYGKLKPIASNIDQMFVTLAIEPLPNNNFIDRYIVAAEHLNITPVLLLNKIDLMGDTSSNETEALISFYQSLDYITLKISSKNRSGYDSLEGLLVGNTSIFVGQSGVGKSSIIQALLPNESIKIGDLSENDAKGRHTTSYSQLYHFPNGGDCIDSPGIREFGLWHLQPDDVINGFVELRHWASRCKFRDCSHTHEPHCAVLEALALGKISSKRFNSYQSIIQSLNDVDIQDSFR